jgi:NAD(P)-dependent dehydrogenase (short-subunit alcohol dehydrogenase family)
VNGQVCVVTGASSGIGRATAVALAGLGAEVIMVCRDAGRAGAAAALVTAEATGPPPRVELADLSRLADVRDLAGRLAALPRLDVLINNAGQVMGRRRLSADGLEYTFALNHLAPFLLTALLRDRLAASAPARVITVSSVMHRAARLRLADLQLEDGYAGWRAYANSKLANILFTTELARRLDGTGVTANCLHPGVVSSGFGRGAGPLTRAGLDAGRRYMVSADQAAGTVVHLASSAEAGTVTGGYWVSGRLRRPSRAARDTGTARQLWVLSAGLAGLADGQSQEKPLKI